MYDIEDITRTGSLRHTDATLVQTVLSLYRGGMGRGVCCGRCAGVLDVGRGMGSAFDTKGGRGMVNIDQGGVGECGESRVVVGEEGGGNRVVRWRKSTKNVRAWSPRTEVV